MVHRWFRRPKRMVSAPLLLALVFAVACGASATATPLPPTATAAPTATTAQTVTEVPKVTATPLPASTRTPKPQVARLRLAIAVLNYETNLFWESAGSAMLDKRPMMEHLIDVDLVTLQPKPMLATRWEMGSDSKTWTFHLRKGVPFSFGWGEFTGRDVLHSLERLTTSEDSIVGSVSEWRTLVGRTSEEIRQNVKVVDNYQVVFNLKLPSITIASFLAAAYSDLFIVSKAQWDQEGAEGMRQRPAGTGSYQYQVRKPGELIRYERVDNHWRQTPEFKELEIRFPREDATRLAMLLAGETDFTDIPRSLHKQAVAKGMKLLPSRVPISAAHYVLGGLYSATPEKYDPTLPFAKREVREALNRAINRKEIQQTIFEGKGEPMYVSTYHPTMASYNPEWEKRFEAKYGYDPEGAKKLIAQAGYPEGFAVKLSNTPQSGLPEVSLLIEAMYTYLRQIGLKVEIEDIEISKLRSRWRGKNAHGLIWAHRSGYQPLEYHIQSHNYSKSTGVSGYEDPRIDQKHETLRKSLDLVERERLLKEIGDILFEEYSGIPLFWLTAEAVVNPTVISEYNFGIFHGIFTHLEYVKGAK